MHVQRSPPPPPTNVFTDKNSLRRAIIVWCSEEAVALDAYGPISRWDVRAITDMSRLFEAPTCPLPEMCPCNGPMSTCNPDIVAWDMSSVTRTDCAPCLILALSAAPRSNLSSRIPPRVRVQT